LLTAVNIVYYDVYHLLTEGHGSGERGMNRRMLLWLAAMLAVLAMAGCATLRPDFETPTVTVNSIRLLPSGNIVPQFEVGLHIANPNRTALSLQGIAYTLSLDGFKVISGVANDLPTIDAYGQGDITLVASVNLMSSIRLLSDLMNQGGDAITYELDAKLDLGGILPTLHVTESGEIDLAGQLP
jgi:LEA14-like dessication related protein